MLRDRADIFTLILVPLTFIIVFKVSGGIGLTWDEGIYIKQARQINEWVSETKALIRKPKADNAEQLLSTGDRLMQSFKKHWLGGNLLFTQNPPFSPEVQALTISLYEKRLGVVRAARLATVIFFSIAAALVFRVGKWAGGWTCGLAAYGFLLTMPRVVGHAGLAATDSMAMSMGFITAALWLRYANKGKGGFLIAVVLGLALLTKFTVIILIPVLVLWAWLFQKKWLKASIYILFATPVIMIIFNPRWWVSPITGIKTYITLSLTRGLFIPIPTYYLGSTYEFGLPWHHPPLMLLATIPLLTIAAICLGAFRRKFDDASTAFFLLPAIAYIFTFELPNAPGHDGVRLFMPVFPFLAGLGGMGVVRLKDAAELFLVRRGKFNLARPRNLAAVLLAVFIVPPLIMLARSHPNELEYYSASVGGIRGAHRLGLETTYWLDVLNEEALQKINEILPKDASIMPLFPKIGCDHLSVLQSYGLLRVDLKLWEKEARYYLQPSRQGLFTDVDWIMYRYGKPIYQKSIKGVKLLALYDTKGIATGLKAGVDARLASHPDDLQAHYEKGIILMKAKSPLAAAESLKKALPLEKRLKTVHMRLGEALSMAGKYPEAEKELMDAIKSQPDSSKPYIALAMLYMKTGKLNLAEKYFKLALERRFNDPDALRGLSDIAKIRRQWSPIK